ncbi:MAG: baseplate J/gp47 family protein, partial [Blastocatellia bacterium]
LDIPAGVLSATVSATSEVLGNTGRLQTNSLILLRQSIAGIGSVSNVTPLSGGVDGESVPQAEIRARELVALGQHLGNVNEWSAFIFFQVLNRKGRITAFEGYNALFQQAGLGYLLLVVQDDVGAFPAQNILNAVSALIATRHVAGLQVSVTGPQFVCFNLSVNVTIAPGFGSGPLIAKATANLQSFYNPLTFPYGPTLDSQGNIAVRYISLSDIIGQVEQAGPQAISVKDVAGNFQISITINGASGSNDVALTLGQLPQIGNITLNVVQ